MSKGTTPFGEVTDSLDAVEMQALVAGLSGGARGITEPTPSAIFDDLVVMVSHRLRGHAFVYLVTPDSGLIQAAASLSARSVPVVDRLCAEVADERATLIRRDISRTGAAGSTNDDAEVRFYIGVPLISADGAAVGVLCAWDSRPHSPTSDDIVALEQFGRHATTMIELHRVAFELDSEREVLTATGFLLEMIVGGAALPVVLTSLALAAEAAIPGTTCSIHLLDGSVLRGGASPHLPAAYRSAIDGREIGPNVGSCGTAAYTGQTVIVSDIETDPRWVGYRQLALPHGLRACWSVPIKGSAGLVLGIFALYYREIRVPRPDELERLDRWVNLAEVAISRARDITALREAATMDALTGLVNRASVMSRISAAVTGRVGRPAVLFVDLDQFKFVNDTLGHAAGDKFLQIVARRLNSCAGVQDTVARFGGDEFVVLRPDCTHDEAAVLARNILAALHSPMTIDGRTLSLSASVGIAVQHDLGDHLDLVGDADLAMYAAKKTGRNSFAVFTPHMRAEAADRLGLEADLSLALANGELRCAYQPSVEMNTGRILGVEALLRWNSPTRGAVAPDDFVPVAEESGLVGAVGQFALERACAQMAKWRAISHEWRHVVLWVNVSPRQLVEPGFAASVGRALATNGLPAGALGLEVTESSFIEDSGAVQTTLLQLRRRGVHVAIDDFGTGYSSLAQLGHLPVDLLKIDRQFIAEITDGGARAGVVAGIVTLADTMGLRVIAEGVETVEQRDLLLSLGCGSGQGYLWCGPLEPEEFDLSLTQFADIGRPVAARRRVDAQDR